MVDVLLPVAVKVVAEDTQPVDVLIHLSHVVAAVDGLEAGWNGRRQKETTLL